MSDSAWLVAVRAAATRTSESLGDAQIELRALQLGHPEQVRSAGELKDALAGVASLTRALTRPRLVASTIDGLSVQAGRSVANLSGMRLPVVNTVLLVEALEARDRADARREDQRAARRRKERAVPSSASPQRTPTATSSPTFRTHSGLGYQAQLPAGPGWSDPADSEPTSGQLYRTSVRGPDGMVAIIDYTPFEAATFAGSSQSRRDVGQTAFGSATEYVFQGGALTECQRARCVDYIINDRSSGSGFGVLAGGPDFALAKEIGRTVMESLTATR